MIERLLRRAGAQAARAERSADPGRTDSAVGRAIDFALEDLRRRIAISADKD